MELDANGQPVRSDVMEDYTQHEVNDTTELLKQRLEQLLLSWMVHLHRQVVLGRSGPRGFLKSF